MEIPIKGFSGYYGKKPQENWVISYNPDLSWLKLKNTFIIDLQKSVLLANTHCETYMPLFKDCDEKRKLLATYDLYIKQMIEKETKIALELNRLDEKAEKKAARKAGYDLFPIPELNRLDEKAEKKAAKKAGYDLFPV
jgi:hypothetical protein